MAHSKAEARRSGSAVAVTVHYTSYSKLSIHDSVLYCIVLYLFHINYSILISLDSSKSSILIIYIYIYIYFTVAILTQAMLRREELSIAHAMRHELPGRC